MQRTSRASFRLATRTSFAFASSCMRFGFQSEICGLKKGMLCLENCGTAMSARHVVGSQLPPKNTYAAHREGATSRERCDAANDHGSADRPTRTGGVRSSRHSFSAAVLEELSRASGNCPATNLQHPGPTHAEEPRGGATAWQVESNRGDQPGNLPCSDDSARNCRVESQSF